jgi:hypothetical protein
MKKFLGQGIESISPGQVEKNIEAALEEMETRLKNQYGLSDWENKRSEISNRIFYVRSKESFENLGGISRFLLSIFSSEVEDSDGILRESDQYHDRIGIDLRLVQADHFGLTISGLNQIYVSYLTDSDRYAFSRAVFQHSLERLKKIRSWSNPYSTPNPYPVNETAVDLCEYL